MTIHRVNRAVLFLLGVVLALAGGCALLVGTGAAAAVGLPQLAQPGAAYDRLGEAVGSTPVAWQVGLIVGGIVLALLGLRLIVAELRPRTPTRRREVAVASTDRGRTTLRADSVSRALARDLTRIRGVDEASVTARSLQRTVRLDTVLKLARDTALSDVDDDIEAAYDRTRTALSADRLDVRCRIVLSAAETARVR